VAFAQALPRSGSGKVLKAALRERYGDKPGGAANTAIDR
jgi:acyl-CoA synthetase (AMP-forming)/AMP-acid ligase II